MSLSAHPERKELNANIDADGRTPGPLDEYRLPASVRSAIDIVRAAGGAVSAETIELLCRVESGEITTEEAIRLITEMHCGGRSGSKSPDSN